MTAQSCIYSGWVMHRRLKPRRHRLRYRAYWLLIDLDELPQLSRRLTWFSHNRFNLLGFHDADHGSGHGPLRPRIEQALAQAGIVLDGGSIRLLCMPRVLGYAFNPLSVYFCHARDGALAAVLYEVHNTFGQRHTYLIAVNAGDDPVIRQRCAKQFHVSPFMGMDMTYDFRLTQPGGTLGLAIRGSDSEGPMIHASLHATRRELSDRQLLAAFFARPLVTLKVIGAIHWEALRLYIKGLKLRPRPAPPARPVTIVSPHGKPEEMHV